MERILIMRNFIRIMNWQNLQFHVMKQQLKQLWIASDLKYKLKVFIDFQRNGRREASIQVLAIDRKLFYINFSTEQMMGRLNFITGPQQVNWRRFTQRFVLKNDHSCQISYTSIVYRKCRKGLWIRYLEKETQLTQRARTI